jgi:hypothetical protein
MSQKTGGAVGWIVDWLKRAVPLATGAGTAGTTLPLETVVPADHPLRLARRALDEALAATADEVAKAAGRLEGTSSPGELAALLLLDTLYDAATADEVAELLRYDLAARWFVGWPNGPFDRPDGAIQEAMRRATGDPLVVMLQSRVLTAPAVAAGLGDRRWRVHPARLRAARRRGRWGEKRLRRQARGGRLWRWRVPRRWSAVPRHSCSSVTRPWPCRAPPRSGRSWGGRRSRSRWAGPRSIAAGW